MNKQKVIDWYYEHTIQGENVFIFRVMLDYLKMNNIDIPDWLKDEDNAYLMDLEYCTAVSGDKYLSKNFMKQYERAEVEVLRYFAMILYRRFNTKWTKIYDALLIEYNPLENYSMDETRTPNLTDEVKNTGDDKTSVNLDNTTTSYIVGYNTANEKESGKTTSNGNATNNFSKVDYNSTHTSKHTGTEHVTRTGNIGVTTSQQMLQSEFEVRQYDFYQGIYNDIDEFITTLKW